MDLEGKKYCGLTIDWNYDKECVHVSMPTYIPKYLKRFLHPAPKLHDMQPKIYTFPEYGQIPRYEKVPDKTPPLDEKFTKDIQSKVVSLLYYSQSVDSKNLPVFNDMADIQAKTTLHTKLATARSWHD